MAIRANKLKIVRYGIEAFPYKISVPSQIKHKTSKSKTVSLRPWLGVNHESHKHGWYALHKTSNETD